MDLSQIPIKNSASQNGYLNLDNTYDRIISPQKKEG